MKTWIGTLLATVVASCLLATSAAHAIPITVSFTVTGFMPAGAPTDPVSGTIVYDAASTTANINSLTSISLTIGGHVYTLAEVGFLSTVGPFQVIGGTANGVSGLSSGTNDFLVAWIETTLAPSFFQYATPSTDIFVGTTFNAFSVTAGSSSVPEPATLALLGLGLFGAALARRRQ